MEKKQRKKGKDKVDARLTSVTLESENRTSTIVKESEVPAGNDHDVEEVNNVGQSIRRYLCTRRGTEGM